MGLEHLVEKFVANLLSKSSDVCIAMLRTLLVGYLVLAMAVFRSYTLDK